MSIDMSFNPSGIKIIGLNIMVHNYILIQKYREIQKVSQNQVIFIMKWTLGRDANKSIADFVGMKVIAVTSVFTNPALREKVRINDNVVNDFLL